MSLRHPDELEIIGTFFVDVLFNHIYVTAINNFESNNVGSITTMYQRCVTAYASEFKSNQQTYTKIVDQLYQYASTCLHDSIGTGLGFNQFVDGFVSLMVPKEYFPSLTAQEKDRFLRSALGNMVDKFSVYCTQNEMLQEIIDKRKDTPKLTLQKMQDQAVVILKAEQVSFLNKFLKHGQGVKENPGDQPTMELIDKMRKVILKLHQERDAAQALNRDLVEQNNSLNRQVRQYKKLYIMQTRLVREYSTRQAPTPEPEPTPEVESQAVSKPEDQVSEVSIQDFIGDNEVPDPSVESDW